MFIKVENVFILVKLLKIAAWQLMGGGASKKEGQVVDT